MKYTVYAKVTTPAAVNYYWSTTTSVYNNQLYSAALAEVPSISIDINQSIDFRAATKTTLSVYLENLVDISTLLGATVELVTVSDIVKTHHLIVESVSLNNKVVNIDCIAIDYKSLQKLYPENKFTTAIWPDLKEQDIDKLIPVTIGFSRKVPFTFVSAVEGQTAFTNAGFDNYDATSRYGVFTYVGPELVNYNTDNTYQVLTTYRSNTIVEDSSIYGIEYIVTVKQYNSRYFLCILFPREQIDFSGGLYEITADITVSSNSSYVSQEIYRLLTNAGILTSGGSFDDYYSFCVSESIFLATTYTEQRTILSIINDYLVFGRAKLYVNDIGRIAVWFDKSLTVDNYLDTLTDAVQFSNYQKGLAPEKTTVKFRESAELNRVNAVGYGEEIYDFPFVFSALASNKFASYANIKANLASAEIRCVTQNLSGNVVKTVAGFGSVSITRKPLAIGQLVAINAPTFFSSIKPFVVESIEYRTGEEVASLVEYNPSAYTYDNYPLPSGMNDTYSPDYSATFPNQLSGLTLLSQTSYYDDVGTPFVSADVRVNLPSNSNWAKVIFVAESVDASGALISLSRVTGTVGVTYVTGTLTGIKHGTSYTISAWAVNASGLEGPAISIPATAIDVDISANPTGLAVGVTSNNFRVTWTNTTDSSLGGVEIWRNSSNTTGTATKVGSVTAPIAEFIDTRTNIARPWYWVRSYNKAGIVNPSFGTGVQAGTGGAGAGLTATPFTGRAVTFSWNALATAAKYRIQVTINSVIVYDKFTTTNTFTWTFEEASENNAVNRQLTFTVTPQSFTGSAGASTNITVSNPQMAAIADNLVDLTSGYDSVNIQLPVQTAEDFAGYTIQMAQSATNSAPVSGYTTVYDGISTSINIPVTTDFWYFFKVAAYDVWGKDNLNYTGAVGVEVNTVDQLLTHLTNQITSSQLTQELLTQIEAPSASYDVVPHASYDFTKGSLLVFSTNNLSSSFSSFGTTFTVTGTDASLFTNDTILVDGTQYDKVLVRIRKVSGSGTFDGKLFYKTTTNTVFQDSHSLAAPSTPTVDWVDLIYDFSQQTNWTTSTITGLKLRLSDTSNSDVYQVKWMFIGRYGPLVSMATQVKAIGSQYTIKAQLTQDGKPYIAGLGVAVEKDIVGNITSKMYILADEVAILPQGSLDFSTDAIAPFIVTDNTVYINTAIIKDGSIVNAKIGNYIQSTNWAFTDNSQFTGWKIDKTGTCWFNSVHTKGITIYDNDGTVLLQSDGNLNFDRVSNRYAVSGGNLLFNPSWKAQVLNNWTINNNGIDARVGLFGFLPESTANSAGGAYENSYQLIYDSHTSYNTIVNPLFNAASITGWEFYTKTNAIPGGDPITEYGDNASVSSVGSKYYPGADPNIGSFEATLTLPSDVRSVAIDTPDQSRYYKVILPYPGGLHAETSGTADPILFLIGSDGIEIAINDDSIGANSRVARNLAAGTYYIRARMYGSNTGTYTLTTTYTQGTIPETPWTLMTSGMPTPVAMAGASWYVPMFTGFGSLGSLPDQLRLKTANYITVTPSAYYQLQARCIGVNEQYVTSVEFYTSANALISTATISDTTLNNSGDPTVLANYAMLFGVVQAPSNAVKAKLLIDRKITGTTPTSAHTVAVCYPFFGTATAGQSTPSTYNTGTLDPTIYSKANWYIPNNLGILALYTVDDPVDTGSDYLELVSDRLSVKATNYYEYSCYLAHTSVTNALVGVRFYNASGSLISSTTSTTGTLSSIAELTGQAAASTITSLDHMIRIGAKIQAPANAVYAKMFIRRYMGTGTASTLFFTKPMFAEATATLAKLSPWTDASSFPGGFTSANITSYIEGLAIGTALIQNAAITNAKIGGVITSNATASNGEPLWTINKDGAASFSAITIKDDNGTVLLQSGGNLEWDRVANKKLPTGLGINLLLNPDWRYYNFTRWQREIWYEGYTDYSPNVDPYGGYSGGTFVKWPGTGTNVIALTTVTGGAQIDQPSGIYQYIYGPDYPGWATASTFDFNEADAGNPKWFYIYDSYNSGNAKEIIVYSDNVQGTRMSVELYEYQFITGPGWKYVLIASGTTPYSSWGSSSNPVGMKYTLTTPANTEGTYLIKLSPYNDPSTNYNTTGARFFFKVGKTYNDFVPVATTSADFGDALGNTNSRAVKMSYIGELTNNSYYSQKVRIYNTERVIVDPLEWYEVSLYYCASKTVWKVQVECYNGTGTLLTTLEPYNVSDATETFVDANNIAAYPRFWAKFQMPANTYSVKVIYHAELYPAYSGNSNKYGWRPHFGRCLQDQQFPSPWNISTFIDSASIEFLIANEAWLGNATVTQLTAKTAWIQDAHIDRLTVNKLKVQTTDLLPSSVNVIQLDAFDEFPAITPPDTTWQQVCSVSIDLTNTALTMVEAWLNPVCSAKLVPTTDVDGAITGYALQGVLFRVKHNGVVMYSGQDTVDNLDIPGTFNGVPPNDYRNYDSGTWTGTHTFTMEVNTVANSTGSGGIWGGWNFGTSKYPMQFTNGDPNQVFVGALGTLKIQGVKR